MNWITQILMIAFSSGVIGTLVSAYFTRRTSKEKNEIDLMGRLYREIERLDSIIQILRKQLEESESENRDLKNQLDEAERQLADARNELDQLKKEHGGRHHEQDKLES